MYTLLTTVLYALFQAKAAEITPAKWEAAVKHAAPSGALIVAVGLGPFDCNVHDDEYKNFTVFDLGTKDCENVTELVSGFVGLFPLLKVTGKLKSAYDMLLATAEKWEALSKAAKEKYEFKRMAKRLNKVVPDTQESQEAAEEGGEEEEELIGLAGIVGMDM